MQTIAHANTFFLISSIGFIVIFIIATILGIYLIKIFRNVSNITKRVEHDIETIGDTAKELVEDLQNSSLFSLLFRKRKKSVR